MKRAGRHVVAAMGILLGLVALLPGVAGAEFAGELERDKSWTLDLTGAVGSGGAAVTVLGLTDSNVRVLKLLKITGSSPPAVTTFRPLNRRIKRISINVAVASGGPAVVRITQGAKIIAVDIEGDSVVVLDLVP